MSLCGCETFGNRSRKILLPNQYVVDQPPEPTAEPLAMVRYATGYQDDPVRLYRPQALIEGEHVYSKIPEVTSDGWVELGPLSDEVVASFWVRNINRRDQGFQQVKGLTGEIPGALSNAIHFFDTPSPLPGPVRLPMSNLFKIFNGFSLSDGDLILIELTDRLGGQSQRVVFQYRAFGVRTRVSYAVLFRVPVPGLQDADTIDVGGLSFTISLSLGYRYRTSRPLGKFISDRFAAVVLAGVGSTYEVDPSLPINDQVRGAYTSGIVGAGIEVFDFLSLNFLLNPSSLTSDASQSLWAAAVGFDAVRFANFTRDFIPRLFFNNELEPMEADTWWLQGDATPSPSPPSE